MLVRLISLLVLRESLEFGVILCLNIARLAMEMGLIQPFLYFCIAAPKKIFVLQLVAFFIFLGAGTSTVVSGSHPSRQLWLVFLKFILVYSIHNNVNGYLLKHECLFAVSLNAFSFLIHGSSQKQSLP